MMNITTIISPLSCVATSARALFLSGSCMR
jgi:hypothetical protein